MYHHQCSDSFDQFVMDFRETGEESLFCYVETNNFHCLFSQVGIASQLLCWTGQFLGHGVFEVTPFGSQTSLF